MGRSISQEKILGIAKARVEKPDALGPMLGEFVIECGVPVEIIAKMLNVAEPTVYRWMFCQAAPRDKDKIVKVKRLLTILRKAKRAKDLPLEGSMKARHAAMVQIVETHKPLPRSE